MGIGEGSQGSTHGAAHRIPKVADMRSSLGGGCRVTSILVIWKTRLWTIVGKVYKSATLSAH
jgi:hypothetical protein